MAATMHAAVRARSRTWIFMFPSRFLHYPARNVCDSSSERQSVEMPKERVHPAGGRAGMWNQSGTTDLRKAHKLPSYQMANGEPADGKMNRHQIEG